MERVIQANMEGLMATPRVVGCLKDSIEQSKFSMNLKQSSHQHARYWVTSGKKKFFLPDRSHHIVKICNHELKELAKNKFKVANDAGSKPSL